MLYVSPQQQRTNDLKALAARLMAQSPPPMLTPGYIRICQKQGKPPTVAPGYIAESELRNLRRMAKLAR